eukprot:COSAG01_NODE_4381_length_5082_cov_57.158539_9_plen_68_part_00
MQAWHGCSERLRLTQLSCQVVIIESVFEEFLISLRTKSCFPGSEEWEAPTVVVVRSECGAAHHIYLD